MESSILNENGWKAVTDILMVIFELRTRQVEVQYSTWQQLQVSEVLRVIEVIVKQDLKISV